MSFPRLGFLLRRPAPDPDAEMSRQIADLDVADINTVRLRPLIDLAAQRQEITRVVEAWAATDAVDRGTGGHLLDEAVNRLAEEEMAYINQCFSRQLGTADQLIGAAEAGAKRASELLTRETRSHARHLALTGQARIELFGDLGAPCAEPASNGDADRHDCPDADTWTPPWASTSGPAGAHGPGAGR